MHALRIVTRLHRGTQAAGVFLLTAALTLAAIVSPMSASAAAGAIEVSEDGVSYGASYPGSLFGNIARLVPGDTDTETFYLRNSGTAPGFLRLILRDVVYSDTDFAHALSVSASTPQFSGEPVIVGSVDPCWVLLVNQRVEPGETVGVTARLVLGNLDGLAGQAATASMVLRISLSDISNGATSPTDCGGGGTDVTILPPTRTATGNSALGNPPGTQITPVPEATSGGGTGELPVLNLPGGIVIDPNTWHLFEEFLVLILFASAVLGSGWFMLVARRRRKREGEAETDVMA